MPDTITPNLMYATAPNFGVFKSTDGGITWSSANTGLNNLQVSALAVDRNGVVLAATTNASDGFVAKVNPTGSALTYLTYIGGDEADTVNAIAVDKDSNAVISGVTSSLNFPTSNPFQAANGGGSDAFIAKLNAAGSGLSWSTYLGGSGVDNSLDLALDSTGRIYITGITTSINFPTLNPLQTTNRGQNEIFLSRLKADGSGLESSTYLGGTRNDSATSMVLGKDGNVFLTGSRDSSDFPLVAPYQGTLGFAGFTATDAFVVKLNPTVSEILYSTYLGGEGADTGYGIAVDAAGIPSVTGITSSNTFPLSNSIQPYKGSG